MIEIPNGMRLVITMIRKEQDKAVQLGKELEAEGFEFKGKGKYIKDNTVFNTGYKDDLDKEYFREIKFEEIKPEVVKVIEKKRKKRIKPAQKNKKAKK